MDTTPNLALPYIAAAQAQKHVTHNEAIRALDALVHLAVLDRDLAAPPSAPADGQRWIVAAAPSGAWAEHASQIAAWQDGAWAFLVPRDGWLAWIADEDLLAVYENGSWSTAASGGATLNPVTGGLVGINTPADAVNRLAVAAPSTLLQHEGTDHRLKIDKATASATASVVFQTNYSGRAEFGTTGSDNFQLKVSADGIAWASALDIAPTTAVGVGTAATGAALRVRGLDVTGTFGDLHVVKDGYWSLNYLDTCSSANAGHAPFAILRKGRGTIAAPEAVQDGDQIGGFSFRAYQSGGAFLQTALVSAVVAGAPAAGSVPTDLRLTVGVTGAVERLRLVGADGTVRPGADNVQSLGSASHRWASIWAANGTIQTSDARDKSVAAPLDTRTAGAAVDTIAPVMFRWRVGGHELVASATQTEDVAGITQPVMETRPVPGRRLHAGFLAQDVKAALDAAGVDFGVWGLDDPADPDSRQWLRPDQLIPVLWAALRETRARVAALETATASLAGG